MGSETSGNPNPVQTVDITTVGHKFGSPGAADPVEAGRKGGEATAANWEYRAWFKNLATQEIDSDPAKLEAELQRLKGDTGKITIAKLTVIRAIERTLKKMEPIMLEKVIDNTEGKLVQELVIPSTRNAPENNVTLEEAAIAYKEHIGD